MSVETISPWQRLPEPDDPIESPVVAEAPRTWGRVGGIDASDPLEAVFTDPRPGVLLVGAHGGAGTSTLSLLTGLEDAGRTWPVTVAHLPNRVLIVAKTSSWGLEYARMAAKAVFAGRVKGIDLLGLVAVADAPGRLPRSLADQLTDVAGAFPAFWQVPWSEELRCGHLTDLPGKTARVFAELSALNERTPQ